MVARHASAALMIALLAAGTAHGDTSRLPPKVLPKSPTEVPILALALSADSRVLATGGMGHTIRLWDTRTGKELRRLRHRRGVIALAFSPDDKLLVSAGADSYVRLWNARTGEALHQFSTKDARSCIAFSPDSRVLAIGSGGTVFRFDTDTGRELTPLAELEVVVVALAFAPDGKTLASATEEGAIQVWDLATGKRLRDMPHGNGSLALAFSPDGKLLAGGERGLVRFWDATTGQERGRIRLGIGQVGSSLAFSGDGRTVATSGGEEPSIRRWDVATGKEQKPLPGFEGSIVPVSFGPDSRGLAALDRDALAHFWDMADPSKKRECATIKLTATEAELLWDDLSSEDDYVAAEAAWELAGDDERALSLLNKHLRPEAPHRPIADLIADLDDNRFAVRQAATSELERVGRAAESALRGALKERPPLEVARRMEFILERITRARLSPERMRDLRAVEVLERVGTSDARRLLEVLTKGAPGALLTRESRATLERLDGKGAR
ncbi:MAG: WD40 repeat domain-containing protein [Gemmataceae bacterium]|nr:WD40 repeat domain-containing protein [Gemmataceae bacterium]